MRRNGICFIFALILGLSILPGPSALAREDARRNFTGTITEIRDSRIDEFTVKLDTYGTFRVLCTNDTEITFRGRDAGFLDLREGDKVTIYGELDSHRNLSASLVDIQRHYSEDDTQSGLGEIGRVTTINGSVTGVDYVRGTIAVEWAGTNVEVLTARYTDIREMGRKRNIQYIRSGYSIKTTGTVEGPNTMSANMIDISQGQVQGSPGMRTLLMGIVTRGTSIIDRNLTVRTPLGEVTMYVPKGITLRRSSNGISVHDIRAGETVQANGTWESNKFVASSVDVSGGFDRDRYFGRVDDIDNRNSKFILKVDRDEYIVRAGDTEITDGSSRARFSDIRNGREVAVYGDLRGGTIYAEKIELNANNKH